MKKILRILAPVGVLAVAVAAMSGLEAAKPVPEKVEEKPRPLSLAVEPAEAQSVKLSVAAQGEVMARTEIDLVPQVTGRIVSVSPAFAEGGAFKAGEKLIQIDDRDYKLAVIRAEARVAEAAVRLEQELADARIKAKQWKDWVQDGEPTPLALNKPQVAEAQSKLRAAEADLQDAQLDLERTQITVPFDGRVKVKSADLGQYVSVGTKLGRVFDTSTVEVKLALTDDQLSELNLPIGFNATGNAPKVALKARIASEDRIWHGSIVRTHAAIDKATRMIYAVAQVNDPYGAAADRGTPLAVGMFVSADISGVHETAALVIPRLGLRKQDTVYVVDKDNKLTSHTVEVLATNSNQVYVGAGLNAGDRVVVSPMRTFVEGMEVAPYTKTSVAANTTDK